MTQLIVAMTKDGGIGLNNKLPWSCKEELQLFKTRTLNKTLIVGRKTAESLPPLPNRKVICLTRKAGFGNFKCITSEQLPLYYNRDDVFIAGGSEVYELVLTKHPSMVKTIHLSVMKNVDTKCDAFVDRKWLQDYMITEKTEYDDFTYYVLKLGRSEEQQYLNLIERISNTGSSRNCRSGRTISIFNNNFTFDLRKGFPLLTTKKMFLRGILEEFVFFIRGDTDTTYLTDRKVNIWKGNTTKEFIDACGLDYAEGIMGPMYGYQWRFFNAPYDIDVDGTPFKPRGGVDQLTNVIHLIKNDPMSRRILMTAYNPEQAPEGVLYPCHSIIIQFYVSGDELDMFCYNRSQDVGLGVPFNIASSSLLLMTVAKLTNKTPRFFHMTMGDTHIYENHIEPLREQLNRIPYKFPKMELSDELNIDNIDPTHFKLSGYQSHPSVKMEMSS